MTQNMHTVELTDEDLDMVAGGDSSSCGCNKSQDVNSQTGSGYDLAGLSNGVPTPYPKYCFTITNPLFPQSVTICGYPSK